MVVMIWNLIVFSVIYIIQVIESASNSSNKLLTQMLHKNELTYQLAL